jgi:hypothetical protein
MASRRIGLTALLLFGLTVHAVAQQTAQPAPREVAPNSAGLDVSRLPLNLSKLNQSLRRSQEREERLGLNLRYSIQVYGSAPRIQWFDPARDNLFTGAVPHTAPSHQDMIQFWTPQEFRSPAMDLNSLGRWLTDKTTK